ncbi:MAG: sulfite exporter TauE/SafE family protein [Oscillospiraceae bacterium]|jgi:sulfite exporter TauE/SafE|nr:sulfite exporter TauE/SafE family protein [Oscillospiraceae bacterium]
MTIRLHIGGMTCVNCENRIARKLASTKGVISASVSWNAGTADIAYDEGIIDGESIAGVINALGYKASADNIASRAGRTAGILLIIAALYMALQHFGLLNRLAPSRLAEDGMGYGMLFVVGLLTSAHCIAMCGGINLSQSMPKGMNPSGKLSALAPAAFYNLGRVVSYTLIGSVLGFAGTLLGGGSGSGLPAAVQGVLKAAAGAFMIVMGINMLGLFPGLRRFQPRVPAVFASKANAGRLRGKGPLIVGLLNGLMPCGPLQSMQILALASGGAIAGGLSMLAFSLGTAPLMLGLGTLVSALGRRFERKAMAVGAVLVVVLGLAMVSQGGGLLNWNVPAPAAPQGWRARTDAGSAVIEPSIVDGVQVVSSTLRPNSFPNIIVKAGMPVRWIVNAPEGSINGCNNRINIYEYGIMNYGFQYGDNVIEFTPGKAGSFGYSCWMGMIRGSIVVNE